MQNPFLKPTGETNEHALKWYISKLKTKSLRFYDCMEKLKEIIESGDKELAKAYGFFTVNVINKSKQVEDKERLIAMIVAEIEQIGLTKCENLN